VFLCDPSHIFDATSFLFWIVLNIFGSPVSLDPMGFVLFRVLKCLKIHHIVNPKTLKEDLDIYVDTLTLAYTSYGAVTGLLSFCIFFFSLLILTFERGEWNVTDKIWVRDVQEGESPFSNIYTCVYFTVVTMTTLGYGDIAPKSNIGRFVAILIVLVGLCNITLLINIVGDCFKDVFRKYIWRRSQELESVHSKYLNKCINDEAKRKSKFRALCGGD